MFNLINKDKEKLIKRYSSINYFIKKGYSTLSMTNNFIASYNIYLIPSNTTNKNLSSYFLYTCNIDLYENVIKIDNLSYTKIAKRYLFLKPSFAYLYLTMTIEKAIEIAIFKKRSKLIFSSCIDHTFEILLDYGFKELVVYPYTKFQKGLLLIKNNKEYNYKNVNNQI